MIVKKLLLLISIIASSLLYGQGQCYNADFEGGNFLGWQGRRGVCCPINLVNNGIVNGRQTIVGPGTDPNTCGGLSTVYAGNFSARLGNDNIGAQSESLSYTFTVLPGGSLIQYAYAVVFQDPDHDPDDQPRFGSRVVLQDGSVIPCTEYYVTADSNATGFQSCPSNPVTIVWKDWSIVTVDLSAYIGQTVTLQFETGDCALGGHFGYAYLDAIYCINSDITIKYCEGDTLATLSAPSGFESYLWDNGDTTATITIDPNLWSNISCFVTTSTGCELVIYSQILPTTVNSNFTYTGECEGVFSFVDSSYSSGSISSYFWDFGDGSTSTDQNPSHYFPPGDWIVTHDVTTSDECISSSSQQITSYPIPISSFTLTDVCIGSVSNFIPSSSPIGYQFNYTWSLGDGTISNSDSISHTYLSSGTYQVSLITTIPNISCSDTVYGVVNVRESPIASFISQNSCQGMTTQFFNTSNLPTWSSNQYFWDFGDGSVSNLQEPTHLYSTYGNYPVSLQVLSSDGFIVCESSYILPISIYPNPNSDFVSLGGCVGDEIQFNNLSDIQSGQISTYDWDFGDGTTSNLISPVHTYQQPGIYSVSLIVVSDSGCIDTHLGNVEINPLPNVQSTSDTICFGQFGSLSAQGADYYSWSPIDSLMDPSSSSTSANPLSTTIYTVVGTDYNGCSNSSQSIVFVNSNPVLLSTDVSVCEGDSVKLDVSGALSYTWSPSIWLNQTFGSSVTSSPDSSISYIVVGVDINGCSSSDTVNVTLIDNPIVSVNSGYLCEGDSILLSASGASTYIWYPSTFLNTTSGSNVISTPGSDITYSVVGISQDNCRDTVESIIIVYPESDVSFSISDIFGCSPLQVNFFDGPVQNISSWSWNFGDGNFSSNRNPSHTYLTSGSYIVTLNVTTNDGCVYFSDDQGSVLIYPNPISDFDVSSVSLDEFSPNIRLNNTSVGGYLYTWVFGDGTYNYQYNPPIHSYGGAGTYQISLEVVNEFGCLDTSFTIIHIDPSYTFYIPNSFTPNGDGSNDIFFGKGSGYKEVTMRIFDRWGELIFESTSKLGPNIIGPYWTGKVGDTDCQIDVYNYQFFVTDVFDIHHTYIGSVTLVR